MFLLCCIFFPLFPFFSVSFWTTKWQLLFPQQPRGNHSGETRLHPPLEENETKRQRVNTAALRERQGSGGGTARRKVQTETDREKDGELQNGEYRERKRERKADRAGGVWMWPEFETNRRRETAINKLKHERGVMELVLTQIYPVGWGRRQEVTRYIDCLPSPGSKCLPPRINWFWHFLVA